MLTLSNVNCLFKLFFLHIELPFLKGDFAEEGIMCMMLEGPLHRTE